LLHLAQEAVLGLVRVVRSAMEAVRQWGSWPSKHRFEESLMGRGRGGPRPESAGGRVRIRYHLHTDSLPTRWCL